VSRRLATSCSLWHSQHNPAKPLDSKPDAVVPLSSMRHLASDSFWSTYDKLPPHIRALADKNFALLKANPQHPSLHFKKVGRFWSVRVGIRYRAIATEVDGDFRWHWIGQHDSYESRI
jgi:hypothetical protein